ncbi:MAG: hypothetical protein JOY68_00815 [Candidatus Dormibacteraeota bacterium]|nr:hypothetical protein [Candidatus Dormibacteraeota bacterium]
MLWNEIDDPQRVTPLLDENGNSEGSFPATWLVFSTLGSALLAGPSMANPQPLYEVRAGGVATQLETVPNLEDAVGALDGHAWAWLTAGSAQLGCSGAGGSEELNIASAPGTGRVLASLPALPDRDSWKFVTWNAQGVVLQAMTCGLDAGPEGQLIAVDPSTGAMRSLTSHLAGCVFQDIADDGTMVCQPALTTERVIRPDGSMKDFGPSAWGTGVCPDHGGVQGYEGVSLDQDGSRLALALTCSELDTRFDRLAILDTRTGAVTLGTPSVYLAPDGFLPDGTILANTPGTFATNPAGVSYLVSPSGIARLLATGQVEWDAHQG